MIKFGLIRITSIMLFYPGLSTIPFYNLLNGICLAHNQPIKFVCPKHFFYYYYYFYPYLSRIIELYVFQRFKD